jgi:mRNA interferase RelE/StbE
MRYRVEITASALEALRGITDRRTRSAIVRRIELLVTEPAAQGKALRGELSGLMRIRAAGQRYRVVFRVNEKEERIVVLLVGIRREASRQDVYALARRLVKRGLI